ncbi:hypothetical protein SASPL_128977 [Salvia splendens]|uniref:Uncharacterized protein n=1 Tax=Salvia splendens TaxID=180675 RepID=A0A8X8XE70_SALSN|nr:hypothetical protein SASPL_128977 [Salvia splendens]
MAYSISLSPGKISSYSLDSKLGDCFKVAKIRREELQRQLRRSVEGQPLEGFDYEAILGMKFLATRKESAQLPLVNKTMMYVGRRRTMLSLPG